MKRVVALILTAGLIFLFSCGKDESQKYLDNQEKIMIEAEEKINNTGKVDASDVFTLRNNTGKNIYAIEFCAEDKENLLIDNIVLPTGSEAPVKNSGEWEIKAKFLADDGTYYYESFGSVDLVEGEEALVITLCYENGNYSIAQSDL